MATPIEWLSEFQVNTFTANTPSTIDPHIIGLSNGNFLVAWTEVGTTGVATENGTDIVGKIFDAEGGLVRDSYRLNTVSTEDDELDFDIAATNDGGFVLVFREDETTDTTDINFQRHNADGNVVASDRIVTESAQADSLENPQISFNALTDTSFVTYTLNSGGDEQILGVTVNNVGNVTNGPYDAAQNSPDDDRDGDVAVLANGNIVSVYEETDVADVSIEFSIYTPTGTAVITAVTVSGGGTDLDPQVTALANGNFVVTYEANDVQSGNIEYRIYNALGSSVAGPFTVSGPSNANIQNEPEVIALPDGDFVILWDDDSTDSLIGQRLNSSGTFDGDQFVIENLNTTSPNIGVTSDGRLLFTWSQNNNVWASIWDPRSSTIEGSDYDQGVPNFVDTNVITSLTTSSTVNGTAIANTILGQDGDDTLNGFGGDDTIVGGGGDDVIDGGAGGDSVDGGIGNDVFVVIDDNASNTYNGEGGVDTLDFSTFGTAITLDAEFDGFSLIGGTTVTWSSIEGLIGTSGADTLQASGLVQGGAGDDNLRGSGDTSVEGEAGNDTLVLGSGDGTPNYDGGADIDTFDTTAFPSVAFYVELDAGYQFDFLVPGFFDGTLNDIENYDGGGGSDLVIGTSGANLLMGNGGNDTLEGGGGNDTLEGGTGDNTLSFASATTVVTVNLAAQGTAQNTGGSTGTDTFTDFDNVIGGTRGDDLTGSSAANRMEGGNGNDLITGRGGDDYLSGGLNRDNLIGGGGNDTLEGGFADDTLNGGADTDTALYDGFNGGITVNLNLSGAQNTGAAGSDTFISIENLIGDDFNDRFTGTTTQNLLEGGSGSDRLFGIGGNDTLDGGAGNDNLQGGGGDDVITGGLGRDIMRGGTGDDVFVFNDISETVVGGQRSRIDNFSISGADGNDTVDISAIDANSAVGGNQAFSFIGSSAFSNTAGQLRFFEAPGPRRIAEGDVNGDGIADFQIEFFNFNTILIASDFIL